MTHQCCCALVDDVGGTVNRCAFRVESNDQPFCDSCEKAGHPAAAWQRPQLDRTEVTP